MSMRKTYVAARPVRDTENGSLVYKPLNNLQLITDAGGELMDQLGKYHTRPAKFIQFSRGKYETEDPEEQAFIENHADFKEGTIFVVGDKVDVQETTDQVKIMPIRRLSPSTLGKMTKEELLDYGDALSAYGTAKDQVTREQAADMNREQIRAYLQSS